MDVDQDAQGLSRSMHQGISQSQGWRCLRLLRSIDSMTYKIYSATVNPCRSLYIQWGVNVLCSTRTTSRVESDHLSSDEIVARRDTLGDGKLPLSAIIVEFL